MSLLVGDRVQVTLGTAYTSPGPGTLVGIDRHAPRPYRVTLDNESHPFDVIDLHGSELEPLASHLPEADRG